jgi:hypothetical protein
VPVVTADLQSSGFDVEILRVPYEFQARRQRDDAHQRPAASPPACDDGEPGAGTFAQAHLMRTFGLLLFVLVLSAAGCSFGSRNSRDDAALTLGRRPPQRTTATSSRSTRTRSTPGSHR